MLESPQTKVWLIETEKSCEARSRRFKHSAVVVTLPSDFRLLVLALATQPHSWRKNMSPWHEDEPVRAPMTMAVMFQPFQEDAVPPPSLIPFMQGMLPDLTSRTSFRRRSHGMMTGTGPSSSGRYPLDLVSNPGSHEACEIRSEPPVPGRSCPGHWAIELLALASEYLERFEKEN